MEKTNNTKNLSMRLWAVGGGKGGVGKSVVTVFLGNWLARLGKRVILVDADLGGANLHTLLGIKIPKASLNDFLNSRLRSIEDLIMETTISGLSLISGASDILGLANPKYYQKMKLMRALNRLDADFILLDLGAGTSFNVLDFFLFAGHKIVVFNAQPTSVQSAYGFIKGAVFRRLSQYFAKNEKIYPLIQIAVNPSNTNRLFSMSDLLHAIEKFDTEQAEKAQSLLKELSIYLINNMVVESKDRQAFSVIQSVAEKYLGIYLKEAGCVPYDPSIEKAVKSMSPQIAAASGGDAMMNYYQIATQMIAN